MSITISIPSETTIELQATLSINATEKDIDDLSAYFKAMLKQTKANLNKNENKPDPAAKIPEGYIYLPRLHSNCFAGFEQVAESFRKCVEAMNDPMARERKALAERLKAEKRLELRDKIIEMERQLNGLRGEASDVEVIIAKLRAELKDMG